MVKTSERSNRGPAGLHQSGLAEIFVSTAAVFLTASQRD
jgi:hypothetical protein